MPAIPIVGGTVVGPLIAGRILNAGADWQTALRSGVAYLRVDVEGRIGGRETCR